jgi:hypothetical protein
MKQKHQENVERWKKFWGLDKQGGSVFGHKIGDTEVWTIECNDYTGLGCREMADRMAKALKGVASLDPGSVSVLHGESQSRVLYGKYRLEYVRAEVDSESHAKGDVYIKFSDQINRDLAYIRSLAIGEQFPFFSARRIPQPTEDVGPPEWDLRNARGVYTLNVGVTYGTPTLHDYKKAAVEWVKALRDEGYEAYYYHSPDEPRSSICVGTFGSDALVEWYETVGGERQHRTRYSDAVEALRARSDFQYNLENGHRTYRKAVNEESGTSARMPNRSFLVKIPREEEADGL